MYVSIFQLSSIPLMCLSIFKPMLHYLNHYIFLVQHYCYLMVQLSSVNGSFVFCFFQNNWSYSRLAYPSDNLEMYLPKFHYGCLIGIASNSQINMNVLPKCILPEKKLFVSLHILWSSFISAKESCATEGIYFTFTFCCVISGIKLLILKILTLLILIVL